MIHNYIFGAFLTFLLIGDVDAQGKVEIDICAKYLSYLKADEVKAYCVDGVKRPLIMLHMQSAYHQKVKVYLNGRLVTETKPPNQVMASATINQYLIPDKENEITVEYEIVHTEVDPTYGIGTFKITLKKQNKWKDSKDITVFKIVTGPDEKLRKAGVKGAVTEKFNIAW